MEKIYIGQATLFSFVFGCIQLFAMAGLIWWQWKSSRLAMVGDQFAADVLVLPVYRYIIYYVAVLDFASGLIHVLIDPDLLPPWVLAVEAGLYHFQTEGLALFLMSPGVGRLAVRRTLILSVTWGLVTGGLRFLSMTVGVGRGSSPPGDAEPWSWGQYIRLGYTVVLVAFYAVLATPFLVQVRRPSLTGYALFWGLYRVLEAMDGLLGSSGCWPAGERFVHNFEALLFVDMLQPLVIYWALLQDSKYWQGLYSSPHNNLNRPLLGMWGLTVGSEAAEAMAQTVTELSKRSPAPVPILPFGFLEIDTRTYFPGGTARVYVGKLKREVVAVKMLFCMELTPKTITDFCEEAAVLRSLAHPNIVHCHGVCVMPPAICLVVEYCSLGSLFQFLHGNPDTERWLSWDVKLRMMRDCTAGIAYLHQHGFIHCDIKSLNFLLTEGLRVKLADLGHSKEAEGSALRSEPTGAVWSAPEVLSGQSAHTPRSDIYSLALVFYEILTGIIPFDTMIYRGADRKMLAQLIFEQQERPSLPLNIPQRLTKVIQQCWAANPWQRLKASDILVQLEKLAIENSMSGEYVSV